MSPRDAASPAAGRGATAGGEPRPLIANSDLFKGLDAPALDKVLAEAMSRPLRCGASLLKQGDPSSQLYFVVEGVVKLGRVTPQGTQIILHFMGPGDLIGCAAVFRRIPYPASAVAVTDASVMSWPSARILELMERDSRLAANALEIVSARTGQFMARVQELTDEPVPRRLARALLRLVGQSGRPRAAGVEIAFALSRQDLAELSGTTVYTVSRILSRWEEEGIVKSARQRVVVSEPERLARLIA